MAIVRNIKDLKGLLIPEGDIRVDRGSYLGNPFEMGKDETLRVPVCAAHKDYTERVLAGEEPVSVATAIAAEKTLRIAPKWKRPTRQQFMRAMQDLEKKNDLAKRQNRELGIWCWCAKKQCHGDTYKDIVERSQSQNLTQTVLEVQQQSSELPATTKRFEITDSDLIELLRRSREQPQGEPQVDKAVTVYNWAWYCPHGKEGYELSTTGDRRFSALVARLKDGRTIEEAYQLDVKGYRAQGNDWRLGKSKPPLIPMTKDELYNRYKDLWRQWATENPNLMAELAQKARGKVLTDKFASTPVSQARVLAELLNDGYEMAAQQEQASQPPLSEKPYNPIARLKPINANVARHMVKDLAMGDVATQFIGMAATPKHVPSSTRNYLESWDELGLANTGRYTAQDKVMVSGSGEWKRAGDSRTKDQIKADVRALFKSHYIPLLDKAVEAGAQILVGGANGTDQLVLEHLKSRGYQLSLNPQGYYECSRQQVKDVGNQALGTSKAPLNPAIKPAVAPGINIYSGSSDRNGLGAALANPTTLSKQKGTIKKDYPVTFKGTTYPDAETAYQTLSQGKLNEPLMGQIIAAKLTQHPNLMNAIAQNGGVVWLEQCRHITYAKTPSYQAWEGEGRNSIMIRCLIRGYELALSQVKQSTAKQKRDENSR